MSQLSVRDAAYRVGITRQTLFKYIRDGKVSATVNRAGQKQIDVSELLRVFGELQPITVINDDNKNTQRQSPITPATDSTTTLLVEIEKLKERLLAKEAALEDAAHRIAELKQRERSLEEDKQRFYLLAEQAQRLLTFQQTKTSNQPSSAAKTKKQKRDKKGRFA